jgi:hypothetical protein
MERRTLAYWIIFLGLIAAIAVVGVLALRKRATPPVYVPVGGSTVQRTQKPPESKPLDAYIPAQPYSSNDTPVITIPSEEIGGAPREP